MKYGTQFKYHLLLGAIISSVIVISGETKSIAAAQMDVISSDQAGKVISHALATTSYGFISDNQESLDFNNALKNDYSTGIDKVEEDVKMSRGTVRKCEYQLVEKENEYVLSIMTNLDKLQYQFKIPKTMYPVDNFAAFEYDRTKYSYTTDGYGRKSKSKQSQNDHSSNVQLDGPVEKFKLSLMQSLDDGRVVNAHMVVFPNLTKVFMVQIDVDTVISNADLNSTYHAQEHLLCRFEKGGRNMLK